MMLIMVEMIIMMMMMIIFMTAYKYYDFWVNIYADADADEDDDIDKPSSVSEVKLDAEWGLWWYVG